MLTIDQNEHGHLAVDHHGVNGGDIQLPVIGDVFGFLKSEVVAFGTSQNLAVFHDADGDVDLSLPRVVLRGFSAFVSVFSFGVAAAFVVISGFGFAGWAEVNGVCGHAITQDGKVQRLFLLVVDSVLPFFCYREHLDGFGFLCTGRSKRGGSACCTGTRIAPGERSVGVRIETAVFVDIRLHFRGNSFAILDIRDIVQRGLRRVNFKSHRIGNIIQQGTHRAEIPIYCAVCQFCLRRIVIVQFIALFPLVLELSSSNFTVHGDGMVFRTGYPSYGTSTVLVIGNGIYNIRYGIVNHAHAGKLIILNRNVEPVFIRTLIHLEKMGNLSADAYIAGGTVADGYRIDA